MLRPFFPELVMSTDLLSFEHPSVLLFCFVDKFYRRLRLIRTQHFDSIKSSRIIVILWAYFAILSGLRLIWHFLDIPFQCLKLRCLANDHNDEIHLLSILLFISDLKW